MAWGVAARAEAEAVVGWAVVAWAAKAVVAGKQG
jgi:hypothetical protein